MRSRCPVCMWRSLQQSLSPQFPLAGKLGLPVFGKVRPAGVGAACTGSRAVVAVGAVVETYAAHVAAGLVSFGKSHLGGGHFQFPLFVLFLQDSIYHCALSVNKTKKTAPGRPLSYFRSDRSCNLAGTQASGAYVNIAGRTVHNSLNSLYVGFPSSVGTSV